MVADGRASGQCYTGFFRSAHELLEIVARVYVLSGQRVTGTTREEQ